MRKGARTVELSLHRWPYAGRAFRRASVPPLLGGLLTFSLSLVAVGIVVYAGAVPSLAEQSPLVRQWLAPIAHECSALMAPLMVRMAFPLRATIPLGPEARMAREQRASHRTIGLWQQPRARHPTLRICYCWEGGARRYSAVPALLLRRVRARALSADPRTRHTSRRRRPRAIRILQARTRPAQVPRTEAAALLRGILRAAVRLQEAHRRQCCCADTERTGTRPGADYPR